MMVIPQELSSNTKENQDFDGLSPISEDGGVMGNKDQANEGGAEGQQSFVSLYLKPDNVGEKSYVLTPNKEESKIMAVTD